MRKINQLDRFAELVRRHLIHQIPPPTALEMAKEFKISKRTAYRDLGLLNLLILELNNRKRTRSSVE